MTEPKSLFPEEKSVLTLESVLTPPVMMVGNQEMSRL